MPNPDPSVIYKNWLDNYRAKYPSPPQAGDVTAATNSADLLSSAGGMPSQSALQALAPKQAPNTYAPQAQPDYVKQRDLQDQSALMAGIAAMRPAASAGDQHPQALGDNPYTAYMRQNNAAQLAQMQDQTAKIQANRDLYNKLLEVRQSQIKQYADEASASDKTVHTGDVAAHSQEQANHDLAKVKVGEGHDDASRYRSDAMAGVAANRLNAQAHKNDPKATVQAQNDELLLDNAYRLRDSLDNMKGRIQKNPSPLQQDVNDSGVPYAPGMMNSLMSGAYGSQFQKDLTESGIEQQQDTMVRSNTNPQQRITIGQLGLTEKFDLPHVGEADSAKYTKLDTDKSKVLKLIDVLERQQGKGRYAPQQGDNMIPPAPMPTRQAAQQAMNPPGGFAPSPNPVNRGVGHPVAPATSSVARKFVRGPDGKLTEVK